MAIITLTTDFGHRDAYVAILKASILSKDPTITIIDIGHDVPPANVAEGAFLLASAYGNFPQHSVHIAGVDSLGNIENKFIAMELEGQFFICADNGMLSLISNWEPEKVVLISEGEKTSFPARDIMAEVAVKLANGAILEDVGKEYSEMHKFLKRSIKANREEIIGHVAHIDHYGNLITNVPKHDFDILSKDKEFIIGIGKEQITSINKSPSDVEAGDCFVLFNHLDVLEIGIKNGNVIKAKSVNQRKLVDTVYKNDLVFAIGPAGSGKTYIAVALAVQALKEKEVKKIIITRPAVEAGESLGFLPGDLKEKVDPYLRPVYDALDDMVPKEKLRYYFENDIIEIAPLAYMRGRTLHKAFILLDEAQNTTHKQIKMFLTRMGPQSKVIVTGDTTQIDLPNNQHSGLMGAINLIKNIDGIGVVHLEAKDVVRHKLVKKIVAAYDQLIEK